MTQLITLNQSPHVLPLAALCRAQVQGDQQPTQLSTWASCSTVCRDWKKLSQEVHPLALAIYARNEERVCQLIDRGCSPIHLLSPSTLVREAPLYVYPAYFAALDHDLPRAAQYIRDRENGFSDRWVSWKLMCLRFDLAIIDDIDGVSCYAEGLNHFVHHNYLVPDIARSLEAFFQECSLDQWGQEETKLLLDIVNASQCTSCSSRETHPLLPFTIHSDTIAFNHEHWVNIIEGEKELIIGNRGWGWAQEFAGIRRYPHPKSWGPEFIQQCHKGTLLPTYEIDFSEQQTGSCARFNYEPAILSALSLIGQENKRLTPSRASSLAQTIFDQWLNWDHKRAVEKILETASHYSDTFLIFVLASFKADRNTFEQLCTLIDEDKGFPPEELPHYPVQDALGETAKGVAYNKFNLRFLNLETNLPT